MKTEIKKEAKKFRLEQNENTTFTNPWDKNEDSSQRQVHSTKCLY